MCNEWLLAAPQVFIPWSVKGCTVKCVLKVTSATSEDSASPASATGTASHALRPLASALIVGEAPWGITVKHACPVSVCIMEYRF